MKNFLLYLTVCLWCSSAQSQVIMSLLLGDKLNSPYMDFGLEGGLNLADITNAESNGVNYGFSLGFYFDIKSKKNPAWMLNTGVIVKSPMGAREVSLYSLNNPELDGLFADGKVTRELRYFNVPILIKYQFKNNFFIKGGPQLGLLSKAFDQFSKEVTDDEDVEYKNDIKDRVHMVDAGIAVGTGYHFKVAEGMNVGMQYYHGLVTVMKGDTSPKQFNRVVYFTACFPIGKAKAREKAKNSEDPIKS